ncbi:probable magnesium transporter NIPA1 [Cyclospora cayetanensis]|uniref:Probable magnesium transporter NIPA1 n=1 Tax=Cyclospora cayetanensis TaxID=88456 RepID=A0A6P6RUX8_9EIME|nr:probable magnesium transporter NIPA1 [Cyclospora cayetanensis]
MAESHVVRQDLWPLGISIIFCGSLSGAAGDTMVRMSYSAAGPEPSVREMLKKPMFVIGMILTTAVDSACTLGALTFAPSSMVTPFAGVHIFWAVLLSHFWLKESVGRWEVLGSSCVISGVLLLVLFSGKETDITSISQFRAAASTPLALTYISVAAASTLTLVLLSQKLYPCSLGAWEVPIQRLSLALASGVFGGNTNVSAKLLTIAVTQLFRGDFSVLTNLAVCDSSSWQAYAVFFATILLALLQLLFLNTALRKFEAIYVIPTTNSCLVAEGIVGAIMVLREYPSTWVCFLLGLLLCVGGILVLTIKHKTLQTPQPKTAPPEQVRPFVHEKVQRTVVKRGALVGQVLAEACACCFAGASPPGGASGASEVVGAQRAAPCCF